MKDNENTLENFISEKLENFIKYISTSIGEDNNLFKQIKNFSGKVKSLLSFSDLIKTEAKIKKDNFYEFDEKKIIDYLKDMKIENYEQADNGNFINKVKRYLELFCSI